MDHQNFSIKNTAGDSIFYQSWKTKDSPRATICIVHGYAEHSTRYVPIAEFFLDQGFHVYAYDRFGHGRSPGKRGHTRTFELMMQEISLLVESAQNENPDAPIILYGHSQGGNLVLNYILRKKPSVAGAIITGPWIYLGNPPPKYQEKLLRILSKIFPKLSVPTNLEAKLISNDPQEVEKYINDPLVFSTITLSTGVIMMDAADYLKQKHKSSVPILIMHGTKDKVCLPRGTIQFQDNFSGNLEVKFWEDGYHEIHNDLNKTKVYKAFLSWIQNTLADR